MGLLSRLVDEDKQNVAMAAGGMAMLLTGARLPALAMFAKGAVGLEKQWRDKHPRFKGGWKARWDKAAEFYEGTHQDSTNRMLHIIGIPMIVGGAAGLLVARPIGITAPIWYASAGGFVGGWALNLVGHKFYEGNAPAFQDDPLSFIAGPVWDLQQVVKKLNGAESDVVEAV